ncbi:MAG TPA: hypothetical protein VFO33_09630 [Casimicrobiaceae bacterium]|nr:hypothetical protein [Casimicrobiaceae bacterium]
MEDMQILLEPIRASLHQIGEFLPRVLLAIAILVIGWLLAKAVRFAVVRMLRAINFDIVTQKAGIDAFLAQGGGETDTVDVLGMLVYWLALLATLMIAFNSLGLAYVTDLIGRIVLFVPKVMVAVLILAFGAYFANFVRAAVTTYCRNVAMKDAELLGRFAFYAIMAFVILIALEQLALGDIIRETFLILIAAIGLALALAFGIGGAKRAGDLLERWSREQSDEARDSKETKAR